MRTNLDVHTPQCSVDFSSRIVDRQPGGGGLIDELAVYVAGSERVKPAKAQSAAAHCQLRDRLIEELGPVSEYVFSFHCFSVEQM